MVGSLAFEVSTSGARVSTHGILDRKVHIDMVDKELISSCISVLAVAATVVGVFAAVYFACRFIGKLIAMLD